MHRVYLCYVKQLIAGRMHCYCTAIILSDGRYQSQQCTSTEDVNDRLLISLSIDFGIWEYILKKISAVINLMIKYIISGKINE